MSRTYTTAGHDLPDDEAGTTEPGSTRVDPVTVRLAFDAAVDQLTQAGIATVTHEDGRQHQAATPCLLDQLVDATVPSSERSGTSAPGSRPPASLNALSIVAEIGTEMRAALAALVCDTSIVTESLAGAVRLWASHAEQWQYVDLNYLAYATGRAEQWVNATRAVLEPAPRYSLRGQACPVCRHITVPVWSEVEGEYVRQPALAIDTDRVEAFCASCDARWGLDMWDQLARQLENQRREVPALDCE